MASKNEEPKKKPYEGLDLEKIVNEMEDISDPTCIEILMRYVDKIRDEDDNFIQLLTKKCENAMVYWEQPWYQKNPSLSYRPTPTDISDELCYRTDPISQSEHELIERNWRKFRKKYKLPDQIISLARWKSYVSPTGPEAKARLYAVAYLSRGLKRDKYQVYLHIREYYGGYRTGLYTKTEDKIIEICNIHKPELMVPMLTILLGRRRRGVYKRAMDLKNETLSKKRLKWTLPLASKLVNGLMKYTELPLEELKNKHIDSDIWRRLEEDFDQDGNYLYFFWHIYLHCQLFVRCDVKLYKMKKKIFKKLREKVQDLSYKVWRDIRWKDLLKDFPDGMTHRFLYRIAYMFILTLKDYTKLPLEEVVEYALKKLKEQKGKKRNKRLRTLQLREDGQLEIVNYRLNK